jgi:hypothetical protein
MEVIINSAASTLESLSLGKAHVLKPEILIGNVCIGFKITGIITLFIHVLLFK